MIIIFVNATSGLYLGNILDNVSNGTRAIDVFKIITMFFLRYTIISISQNRNIITEFFSCKPKYYRWFRPIKDDLIDLRFKKNHTPGFSN